MILLVLLLSLFGAIEADQTGVLPVNYKGRFIPLEVYSRLVLDDLYNHQEIATGDLKAFGLESPDALNFIMTLYLEGHQRFDDAPLFYLESEKRHLSYNDLKNSQLLESKRVFYEQNGSFLMLPNRFRPNIWQEMSLLEEASNPSLFSESNWSELQKSYRTERFAETYLQAYLPLTKTAYALSKQTSVTFPTLGQLQAEVWYYRWSLISYTIVAYLLALCIFLLAEGIQKPFMRYVGWISFAIAFFLHSLTLALRWYILARPPVSNMAETVIYVPWISSLVGLLLTLRLQTYLPLITATGLGAILLTILEWTFGTHSLENVQAVLNSQLWLTVHVLMIVASYGVLILAGALGHLYLINCCLKKESPLLAQIILQAMYIGVALLIPGTILGGVWAAQSWGRFWDWDPKESWAFISACTYLLIIHAYRFKRIGSFGLAIGSILGLLAISFTWYGVNYILGTGLHSYGFGSGGEWIYYSFVSLELLFIGSVCTQGKIIKRKTG